MFIIKMFSYFLMAILYLRPASCLILQTLRLCSAVLIWIPFTTTEPLEIRWKRKPLCWI